jgi:hypothetical protein
MSRWLIPRLNPGLVFVLTTFTFGAMGTTAIGYWLDTFAWTWPVSLYVAFRAVLALGFDRAAHGWRRQLAGRSALLSFVAMCYGYYRLCVVVGYAMAWGFLLGFVPALPFAVLASRTSNARLRWLLDIVGFVVYFWASALFPSVKDRF